MAETDEDPYEEGWSARWDERLSINANPYEEGWDWYDWNAGWEDADRAIASDPEWGDEQDDE